MSLFVGEKLSKQMLKFVANISKVSRLGFGLPCYQTLSEILADIKSGSHLSKCESLTHRCIAVYLQESIVDIQGRVEKVETQIESCTQKDAELHAIQVRREVLVHDLSSRASVPNRFSSIKLFLNDISVKGLRCVGLRAASSPTNRGRLPTCGQRRGTGCGESRHEA